MITNKEIQATQLSATKKDFYQIWSEIMEIAGKISERWDPNSTNESDPGIVLLKVLAGVGDKINYTIDKNTLEVYMPSAAQADSMRKLCDMMGYSIKYYRSATTDVKISYTSSETPISGTVLIDKFTNVKDEEDSINYITLEDVRLTSEYTAATVSCIEGELVECETDNDNIVSYLQLDDNYRYYLPESQIAENGIFITNINDGKESELWTRTENLNTHVVKSFVYKVGYDSIKGLPYIQFPDDISSIIEDGLKIRYIRTNGANGNISAKRLKKITKPASWSALDSDTSNKDYYNVDNYSAVNYSAATNGKNLESINDAYENYKKTVGTFDTLITCRDYMNAIYNMTTSDANTDPLVSNIVVSDIRDDINKAVTLCTFNEYGICYKNISKKDTAGKNKIDHFDLVLYPFKTINGLNTYNAFIKSFKYDNTNLYEITSNLEENKTLSHNLVSPDFDEIACIKNYLKLSCKIITTRKVNSIEELDILNKVYTAIFENFNMRKLDFGESLTSEAIEEVILNADPRIKSAPLEDPILYTKICTVNGDEYEYGSSTLTAGNTYYNKLALNNILAGRIQLFRYNENFEPEYDEAKFTSWKYEDCTAHDINVGPKGETTYPEGKTSFSYDSIYHDTKKLYYMKPEFNIYAGDPMHTHSDLSLLDNEVVQFRLPNFKTSQTYGAYVSYFIKLKDTHEKYAPATLQTLKDFLDTKETGTATYARWVEFANNPNIKPTIVQDTSITSETTYATSKEKNYVLFTFNSASSAYELSSAYVESTNYYYLPFKESNYGAINTKIKLYKETDVGGIRGTTNLNGLYIIVNTGSSAAGYLVDLNTTKYALASTFKSYTDPFKHYFVQVCHTDDVVDSTTHAASDLHTKDGLGQSATSAGIAANEEYKLKQDEYLCIYYSKSSGVEGDDSTIPIYETYKGGVADDPVIIKPNFQLIDSTIKRKTKGYDKTNSSDFKFDTTITGGNQPAGLFTLSSSEQIDMRTKDEFKINNGTANIYWDRLDDDENVSNDGKIIFTFDEEPETKTIKGEQTTYYSAYTLKDGEYFYYTDAAKQQLHYWGSGTKIKIQKDTPELYKYKNSSLTDSSSIEELGFAAGIPWQAFNLLDTGTTVKKHIKAVPYQYITLVKGNVLNGITNGTNTAVSTIEMDVNKTWKECSAATYTVDGTTTTLPAVNIDTATKWEVRTKLDINVGPTNRQTLNVTATNTDVVSIDKISFYKKETSAIASPELIVTLNPKYISNDTSWHPITYKTNVDIQQSADSVCIAAFTYNLDGTIKTETTPVSTKLFGVESISKNVSLNNFNNGGYTKLIFSQTNVSDGKPELSLNSIVDEKTFGLMMINYSDADLTSTTDNAFIRFVDCEAAVQPEIFNIQASLAGTETGKTKWWKDMIESEHYVVLGSKPSGWDTEYAEYYYRVKAAVGNTWAKNEGAGAPGATWNLTDYDYARKVTNAYHLRKGVNIIKVSGSATIEFYSDATYSTKNGSVIIGPMRLIQLDPNGTNLTYALNPKLGYKLIDSGLETAYAQLMKDINLIDINNDFFYNVIPDNASVIDLNYYDDSETLDAPLAWYDYNNINNKFVISEIDADELSSGITIAKSSKM